MRSVKDSESSQIPLGNYFSKTKDKDDKIVWKNRGRELKMIILRIANQYSYFDAVDNKMIMQTTEFGKGIADSLICYDSEKVIQFEGTAKEFKEWALKTHPKFGQSEYPQSMFKYGTVVYVADPFELEAGTSKGVYKMNFSTTNNEKLWAFQNSISNFPIRFITKFTPVAMDKGTNRWYINDLVVEEEVDALHLVQVVHLKIELDKYFEKIPALLKTPKVDDENDIEEISVEIPDHNVLHTIPTGPTPPTHEVEISSPDIEDAIAAANEVFG